MTEHAPPPTRPGVLIENPTTESLDAMPIHTVVAVWDVRHEYPAYAFTRNASGWNDQDEWNHSAALADWPNIRVAKSYGREAVECYELRLVASPLVGKRTVNADVILAALADIYDCLADRATLPAVRMSNAKLRLRRLTDQIDQRR